MTFPFLDHSETYIPTNIYLDHQPFTLTESIRTPLPNPNTDISPESNVDSKLADVPSEVEVSPVVVSKPTNDDVSTSNTPDNDQHIDIPSIKLESTRKFTHITQAPTHLKDYICNSNTSSSCQYPTEKCMSFSKLSPNHQAYILSLSYEIEPTNYSAASC
ncbi:unnamed protein product [Vicia faba]|nr:unnamed protein product [Vicia faba]